MFCDSTEFVNDLGIDGQTELGDTHAYECTECMGYWTQIPPLQNKVMKAGTMFSELTAEEKYELAQWNGNQKCMFPLGEDPEEGPWCEGEPIMHNGIVPLCEDHRDDLDGETE